MIPKDRMVITQVKGLRVKGVPNTEKTILFNDPETRKNMHIEDMKCILMARIQRVREEDQMRPHLEAHIKDTELLNK